MNWGGHQDEAGGARALARHPLLPAAGAALLLLVLGLVFASVQDVWIDESTQLSGAMLPLPRLFAWLAGAPEPGLGVPPDRMPPVSYLVDAAGLRLLGLSVFGLRVLHLAIACAGAAVLVAAVAVRMGVRAAWLAGAVLVLSPKLIEASVELRAYPIWFALVCVQLALVFRILDRPGVASRPLIAFVLVSMVADWTHFLALIPTCALLVGIAAARLRSARVLRPLTVAGGAILLAAATNAPFVAGASAASGREGVAGMLGPKLVVLWLLRLFGHSAAMLRPAAAALMLGGLALLLLVAVLRLPASLKRRLPRMATAVSAIACALAAGLLVTLLAAAVVRGFDPLKPSYGIWVLPFAATIAGAAVAGPPGRMWRRLGTAAVVVFLVGAVWSTATFVRRASWFVHGPERVIADAVGPDPAGAAVVYRGGDWAYGFFPLQWRYGGRLAQFTEDFGGRLHRLLPGGGVDPAGAAPGALPGIRRLLVADLSTRSYAGLRPLLGSASPTPPPAAAMPGWEARASTTRPGLYWLDMTLLQKKDVR